MKAKKLICIVITTILIYACSNEENVKESVSQTVSNKTAKAQLAVNSLVSSDWTSGTLSTSIVPPQNLKHLSGNLSEKPIWKSNNPEIIRGNGWLMQNARVDSSRGGSSNPLSGTFGVYLFHINQSGSVKYLHVLVSNPQTSALTISGKGSTYTNSEKPLNGSATGQSYFVSKDWLQNTPRTTFNNVTINPSKVYEVYRATLANNNMVDGSYEITASQGVYVYTVVTSTGSINDAVNATQTAAAGDIYTESTNTYGREAGIYTESGWSGTTDIDLPTGPAYMGLCLNTSSKFAVGGTYLQNQNAPFSYKLNGASQNTYGNYGHKYTLTLKLNNPNSTSKNVSLTFASNFTSATNSPSFTFNGPLYLNGALKNIYTTPTQPAQNLATWSIPANSFFNATITFYVPGLITTGQQLILKQTN
ncbi:MULTISPECIES: DUF3370 family protein [unclassified Flavobacterium]|uniref:DUF3370 family protein n=1 Tax=unclassified Flavobacterium TaxID=196869 RepID=UPI00070E961B|nr:MULTISPECIES: DUF3370 family protein [unclassified Flavobacterium]KRD61276.1 hypothetical protein ASE40_06950 [Flavobacterium sp. Root935]BDU25741.1 hypothetical protein FLGSB24_24850 [Flavobacterium sp. GSB-24]